MKTGKPKTSAKEEKTETKLLRETQIKTAAEIIKKGGTVAFRTETVYGLGADATNVTAVEKIFAAKKRPAVNPLIVHFASLESLFQKFPNIDNTTKQVLQKVEKAITVILPRPQWIPLITTGGLETVAVRVPACAFSRKFIKECGVPLAAPSANSSTRPSPTRWQDVHNDLAGRIDAIICGAQTKIGVESTVIKILDNGQIQVLRLGGVNTAQLSKKTGMTVKYLPTNESPGTQFKHYAPACPLWLTRDPNSVRSARAKVIRRSDLGPNPAKNLFAALRDAENCDFIVAEVFPDIPKYQTVNERLARASAGWYNEKE